MSRERERERKMKTLKEINKLMFFINLTSVLFIYLFFLIAQRGELARGKEGEREREKNLKKKND